VALDCDVATIKAAHAAGANVLVTHHPVTIAGLKRVLTAGPVATEEMQAITAALELKVACIAMHTNLDQDKAAGEHLARVAGFPYAGLLAERVKERQAGVPALAQVAPSGFGFCLTVDATLDELAARLAAAFNTTATVWGEGSTPIKTAAFCSGSCGSLVEEARIAQVDCLIGGEAGYHTASNAALLGMPMVLLGHDASELPYVEVLATMLEELLPTVEHVIVHKPCYHKVVS
jgi:putative NIF3 family GTP cyclohydrolase 1 type 2